MYGFEYPRKMGVGRVGLEISLKPFTSMDEGTIEKAATELFDQWKELLLKASGCAVMFWVADGSEILEYNRDMSVPLEWARYFGLANPPLTAPSWDPNRSGLHTNPRYFTDNPVTITYGDLKHIITVIKRTGKRLTGFDIQAGATFDPGPEFAISPFKFKLHKEISEKHMEGSNISAGWVHCTSTLHADEKSYAAYPKGIPEGLPFGTFLGAQYKCFADDLGFDYVWFSNGFGFSRDSWSWKGECFDGTSFNPGAVEKVSGQILDFWNLFMESSKNARVETRGSNLSTGMDIAAHGSPLSGIYKHLPFAPPNSPWAALDAQFGLELAGYMSHIAAAPDGNYLYRFYTHDPWWINSPWFDRYNRSPHDIYLPLSVAPLDENLKVIQPVGINFLTADDSFGHMPRRCPAEVTPFLLDAYSHFPDSAGPVTWVYPFDHYHKIGKDHTRASEVLFGDWFIKSGLDQGMPLNTVISDSNFPKNAEKLAGATVLVMPVPDSGSAEEKTLFRILSKKANVLLYGPVDHASKELLALLGLKVTNGAEGDFIIKTNLPADTILHGRESAKLRHNALVSGGLLNTIAAGSEILVSAKKDSAEYAYAVFNTNAGGGKIIWVRGSFPAHGEGSRLPTDFNAEEFFNPGMLLRSALAKFNINLKFTRYDVNDRPAMVLYSRNSNGYYITGFAPDTTCSMELGMPEGAPVMTGTDCIIKNNFAVYSLNRWWHNECRTFVTQKEEGKVSNAVRPSVYPGIDRRMYLTGLINADVVFYCVPGTKTVYRNIPLSRGLDDSDKFLETNVQVEDLGNNSVRIRNVSGSLMMAWGEFEPYKDVYDWK